MVYMYLYIEMRACWYSVTLATKTKIVMLNLHKILREFIWCPNENTHILFELSSIFFELAWTKYDKLRHDDVTYASKYYAVF